MPATPQKYRLGLDVGTNSLGWAAIALDSNGRPMSLLDWGVRLFPEGRDAKSEAANAVARRTARGQRRRRDRYIDRRQQLSAALTDCGLLPAAAAVRRALADHNPYVLRARALDYPLQPYELGRALFHLNQRRGFQSNRKANRDEKEVGIIRQGIGQLEQRIQESGARTLGEYLYRRNKSGQTLRARKDTAHPDQDIYTDRAMYQREFDAIRQAQEPHQTLSSDQWGDLRDIIFYQRPLRPVEPGWCRFEPEERRAAKALPLFQEFRILEEVNNLKLQLGTEPERSLTSDERTRLLQRLRSGKHFDLTKPPAELKLPTGAQFNLARGSRQKIQEDATAAKLMRRSNAGREGKPAQPALFGPRWLNLPLPERNEIVRFLLESADPAAVRHKAITEWGLSAEAAAAVADLSLPPGYGSLSEKAMTKILPYLEQGLSYDQAARQAGYHHSDFSNDAAKPKLPYYGEVLPQSVIGTDRDKDPSEYDEPARYGRIPNPTVHIGLNQLRRVVNELISRYGKPEEVVVELARELKQNREQKAAWERQQKEGGARNDRLRKDLEESGGKPTPALLEKLRLWEEQTVGGIKVCPYTGQCISFDMAVSARTQVDHLLPFSQTLDDSRANKVLCIAAANQSKGDRSPYAAFGHSPPGYDYGEILARVANFPANKFPANKRWRFQPNAMEQFEGERDFLARQLNDTRYLSRIARQYLQSLYAERKESRQRVRVLPGQMTALLRRGWGIEGMLNRTADGDNSRKTRDDHRHHAVDAFVVANTTQSLLQQFAQAASSSVRDAAENLARLVPIPWDGFHRNQLQERLKDIIISYKPEHGALSRGSQTTTGRLHQETAYGLIEDLGNSRYEVVLRKDLIDFKVADLKKVRDPKLGAALERLWREVGGDAKKFAEQAAGGVELNGRRQAVRRVRIVSQEKVIPIKDRAGKPYKGYQPGGNEFAEIWQLPNGRWEMTVTSTFDANQPGFDPAKTRPHPAAKKRLRLQIDDLGALGQGAERRIVRVRQIDAGNLRVVMDDHNEANVDARIRRDKRIRRETGEKGGMTEEVFSAAKLQRLGFRKVGITPAGHLSDPGPRQ